MDNTVFILGAGASRPYDFPIGSELVLKIRETLKSKRDDFVNWSFTDREIVKFSELIRDSRVDSIDDLLETHSTHLRIGKLAIASVLTGFERPERLNVSDQKDWYRYFWNHLVGQDHLLRLRKYSFITFNYDRSLDYYLFSSAEAFYANKPDWKEAVQRIPIIHVHGDFGILSEKGGNSPYRPPSSRSDVELASRNLRLSHEQADSNAIEKARFLIQEADRIDFLGFGFHSNNLKRLDIDRNSKPIKKYGTGVNLTDIERIRIRKQYGVSVDKDGKNIVDYFKEVHPLT